MHEVTCLVAPVRVEGRESPPPHVLGLWPRGHSEVPRRSAPLRGHPKTDRRKVAIGAALGHRLEHRIHDLDADR